MDQLSYRELQKLAKKHGIKANSKKVVLIEKLKALPSLPSPEVDQEDVEASKQRESVDEVVKPVRDIPTENLEKRWIPTQVSLCEVDGIVLNDSPGPAPILSPAITPVKALSAVGSPSTGLRQSSSTPKHVIEVEEIQSSEFLHPWLSPGPKKRTPKNLAPAWLPFAGASRASPLATRQQQALVTSRQPVTPVRMNPAALKRAERGKMRRREAEERAAKRTKLQ